MANIVDLKVLNTVTALGADLVIGTNGVATLGGSIPFDVSSVASIVQTDPVAEVKEVWTITPTATNSYTYQLVVNGYSKSTGLPLSIPFTVTSDASATATEICDAFRTVIAVQSDLNVVGSGTTTLILTASGITASSPFANMACFQISSNDSGAYASITNTTDGVPAIGLALLLAQQYPAPNNNTEEGFPDIDNLTASNYYQNIQINLLSPSGSGSNSWSGANNLDQIVVLVKTGTTATATTTNYATLCSSWGTVAQFKAGYKPTVVALGANVDYGSNVATRASGSFITEQLVPGDQIAISDGATTSTNGVATVVLPYSDGSTATDFIFTKAYINNANTVSAGAGFVIHRANLPL